jgi:hypothetical protein
MRLFIILSFFVLSASRIRAASGTDQPLRPVVVELFTSEGCFSLRAATQYKDIQLLDVVPMRLQEGKEASETLRLPGVAAAGQFATASIIIRPEAVYRKDQGRYVRFARMDLDFKIPIVTGSSQSGQSPLVATQFTYTNVGLRTSGDFMEGQKTVLGKVSGIADEDAIFAVITLKVLD